MNKIKIIDTPPGFAPEEIRKQWIGVIIPLSENPIPEDKVVIRIGNQNRGGYKVRGSEAVSALKEAGKHEAAEFWQPYSGGEFEFKKKFCKLIE